MPMRSQPSECSEMVSQVLFGEEYDILRAEGRWTQIRTRYDNYEGWVDFKLSVALPDDELERWRSLPRLVIPTPCVLAMPEGASVPISLTGGSEVRADENGVFSIGTRRYVLDLDDLESKRTHNLMEAASRLLGVPYLWGGRTFFGIDCSGFVQAVYKSVGVDLPRDASQQVHLGSEVAFGNERVGDLAFFVNDNGRICHVALCSGKGQVIHSSGEVRFDRLTSEGIYNDERATLTHKLLVIKRLPPEQSED